MKKMFIKSALLTALFACLFISCSDDDNEIKGLETATESQTPTFAQSGVYILNEGAFQANNSKLSYYNSEKKEVTENIFESQNQAEKLKLGGGAQDILIYGAKMYITVTESNAIFVTDLKGKVLKTISTSSTEYKLPRHVAEHGDYVYVDFYSGHIAKIDTTEMKVINQIGIDAFPEQMTIVDNDLFVTNSHYNEKVVGNTITVIDLTKFEGENKKIVVRDNPSKITKDQNGNVYVLSVGNYGDIKSALSVIKKGTYEAEVLKEEAGAYMAYSNGEILLANRSKINNIDKTIFYSYDISQSKFIDEPFITIPEEEKDRLDLAYSISVDPVSSDIYITTADYINTGYVYVFDKSGKAQIKFKSGGINPNKVVFLPK